MVTTSFLEKLTNLDLDQDEKEDKEEEPRSADLLKDKFGKHNSHVITLTDISIIIIDKDLKPDCQENLSNRRRRSSSSVTLRD